ncbi:MAG: hypothetical protein LQ343_005861 [Gyalolechia ehrenbergii]|nr:MAG: hypothetical protein LQ343_005861 [Gyalolechia ehrenbergii]
MENGLPQIMGEEPKQTSEAGHELARKTIEHLQQTSMFSHRLTSFEYWIRDPKFINECEILVCKHGTKRYTLIPSRGLLVHEEDGDPGSSLFTITWSPGSDPEERSPIFEWEGEPENDTLVPVITAPDVSQSEVLSMRSKASEPLLPCIFVALGSLREKDVPVSEGRMQTTYYVVLLNLSTNPVSVWLMFDYQLKKTMWTSSVGRIGLATIMTAHGEDTTRFRDFLHQHSNLGGPLLPTSNVRPAVQEADSVSVPQGDFPIPRPQRTRPSSDKDTVNGCHKRNSLGFTGLSEASTAVDDADNNNNLPTKVVGDKPGKDDQGYFGLPRHDLALLAPDIMSWSTQGFDAQQVHTCLRGTHVHLGSSLRARTATAEEVERIRHDRVNFEHRFR